MEKDRNIKEKEINVPLDVMMDVASIIIETEMQTSISGINENKNVIQITLLYPDGLGYYQKAIENIEAILLDYRHYRYEEEDGDWRDN
jgi:hypothetical protein